MDDRQRKTHSAFGPIDPSISFRTGANPGARYMSGPLVLDEGFVDGRLCIRYWNSNGQVWPEMHFEKMKWNADQPADTFCLSINNRNLAGGFTWSSAHLDADPCAYRQRKDHNNGLLPVAHSAITLLHRDAGIRVKVHSRLDGSSFIIRWLEVTGWRVKSGGLLKLLNSACTA